MAFKKRNFPVRDKKLPKGYDSWLEVDLHQGPLREAQHHPDKKNLINYYIPHSYEYDFMFGYGSTLYLCESKGRFRDTAEARKYHYIRDHLSDWHVYEDSEFDAIEMFFIFDNSMTPMPFAKKRKDGTKQTHGEWAGRHGYRWLCKKRGDLVGVDSSASLISKLTEMN